MKTPLLTPAALMSFLAVAQPALAAGPIDKANAEHAEHGEAFRSYAVLARADDPAAQFKLATLYYMGHDDVRAAMWALINRANAPYGGW